MVIHDHDTLAQARDKILNSPVLDGVLGLVKITRTVRVRFMSTAGPTTGTELPDTMMISSFRALVALKMASLVIDDMGGGTRVSVPEPEMT